MPIDNDYNLLVYELNELADMLTGLREEVDQRLLREKQERLEPNTTEWVNLLAQRIAYVPGIATTIYEGCQAVLSSWPGEAVFTGGRLPPPNAPP